MRSYPLLLAVALSIPAWATKTIVSANDILRTPYTSLIDGHDLTSRQESPSRAQADNGGSSGGSVNLTSWASDTTRACNATLANLSRVNSESGMSVCFNIPTLDANNGTFEADLRLYRVTPPRGPWVDVDPRDVNVNVAFPFARVRSVSENELAGMGLMGDLIARQVDRDAGDASLPEQVQSYMLAGQINKANMTANMTLSVMEQLLMPVLSLSAAVGSRNITSSLSPNEASFTTGVFSNMSPMSSFSAAEAAINEQLRRLDEGDVAFVLPGTQILIFPIGLIITMAWTLMGLAAYGFGTVERWRFRELYKERSRKMSERLQSRTRAI